MLTCNQPKVLGVLEWCSNYVSYLARAYQKILQISYKTCLESSYCYTLTQVTTIQPGLLGVFQSVSEPPLFLILAHSPLGDFPRMKTGLYDSSSQKPFKWCLTYTVIKPNSFFLIHRKSRYLPTYLDLCNFFSSSFQLKCYDYFS